MPKHWLIKSEPHVYSIDHLARDKTTAWEGVRNYTARNFMRDDMKKGDLVLFYHSSAEPPGVAGIAKIVSDGGHDDATQFDKKSPFHDPKAAKDKPRWIAVDVGFVEKFRALLPLAALRENSKLKDMLVLAKGQRLSVQPVTAAHFDEVCRMAGAKTKG